MLYCFELSLLPLFTCNSYSLYYTEKYLQYHYKTYQLFNLSNILSIDSNSSEVKWRLSIV